MGGIEMTSFGIPVVGKTYGVWNPGPFSLFCFRCLGLFTIQHLTGLLGRE